MLDSRAWQQCYHRHIAHAYTFNVNFKLILMIAKAYCLHKTIPNYSFGACYMWGIV